MNVDDYRKAYAAEVEKAKAAGAGAHEFALMAKSRNTASPEAGGGSTAISQEIAVFQDASQPSETRLAALQNVQTATFLGPRFDPFRAAFRDALRKVAS